eukprot:TRINITY_DN4064_c1_g1_i1.p1 TRINITY_DN4064_c1_g1~~TRINITY_DN4064_c1_g1_i1.p1  ORF type:complete len:479 (+),score=160.86 TRINITY_DN4064_c1_g1_i1:2-1438(+)
MLLFGPPGTGKSLLASRIGQMLHGKIKEVCGPEVLNKYVGQAEENIRNLFKEAEQEYKEKGDDSDLHVIIFDEIDSICKQRGSKSDSGVGDNVVAQLISKIQGTQALNNIFVIGMTNRKDLLDEALIRKGRLELHIEVALPDEHGRQQILQIHTKAMRQEKMIADDVDLDWIAKNTKNYSGAELASVVRSASNLVFERNLLNVEGGFEVRKDAQVVVTMDDFRSAITEVKPTFGMDSEEFECRMSNEIVNYGPNVEKLLRSCKALVKQIQVGKRTSMVSLLLEGATGSGKSALAAKIAVETGFPFVRVISSDSLASWNDTQKFNKITKIFEDSYRSPYSCIVLDDIERIVEYVRVGARFSNGMLQALLGFLKKEPKAGKKLLVIGTTSNSRILEDLELLPCFTSFQQVPVVSTNLEFQNVIKTLGYLHSDEDLSKASRSFSHPIPVKKVIALAELASQEEDFAEQLDLTLQDLPSHFL